MELKSGHFNIFSILEFVAKNSKMPSPRSKCQKLYKCEINKLIECVPSDKPGWYLWGRFNDAGWWETIYLGRAGKQKTSSLYTRIYDELREEAVAFWAFVWGREVAAKQAGDFYKHKYDKGIQRALRKLGSQFVIWVAVLNKIAKEEIKKQEDVLIKIYRPTHNAQRSGYTKHDLTTEQIEETIEKELGKIREGSRI